MRGKTEDDILRHNTFARKHHFLLRAWSVLENNTWHDHLLSLPEKRSHVEISTVHYSLWFRPPSTMGTFYCILIIFFEVMFGAGMGSVLTVATHETAGGHTCFTYCFLLWHCIDSCLWWVIQLTEAWPSQLLLIMFTLQHQADDMNRFDMDQQWMVVQKAFNWPPRIKPIRCGTESWKDVDCTSGR
jgi:hypothetical protein